MCVLGGARIIFYIWKLLNKKIFNFHSIFAFNLRNKLKSEPNMRKKKSNCSEEKAG